MTNDFRSLDALIGLAPVGDMPPPLLGGQPTGPASPPPAQPSPASPTAQPSPQPTPAGPTQTRSSRSPRPTRPTRTRRPTAVRPPSHRGVARVSAPSPVRPPARVAGVAPVTRPLLSAVSAPTGRRGAEPVSPPVTAIAWLLMVLAAGNAYLLFRTHGGIGTGLPFAGVVDYGPAVTTLITWAGHPGWPTWLSAFGAVGLALAAVRSRGLREVGGGSGATMFVSILFALAGVAGSLAALVVVAFAATLGVAIVVALTIVVVVGMVALLVGLASA
ncbi:MULTISPECIES: hypothetical protein [Aeromicrobium]|uniref:hypothetical protein n=1 Tax=Aeromicrobium TaxID=2040 RepID=UPI0025797BCF|nr:MULTISPECIES: hypothetical protein [Aeromicrobium]